ncbi:hypothetical protein WMZ97_06945 [Lentibacillus sp. N15]
MMDLFKIAEKAPDIISLGRKWVKAHLKRTGAYLKRADAHPKRARKFLKRIHFTFSAILICSSISHKIFLLGISWYM